MDARMTNEKTVTCDACSCTAPVSSCVKSGDKNFCSKDCCIKSKTMPLRKHGKNKVQVATKKLNSFDWGSYLDSSQADAVPVTSFKHCMLDGWLYIGAGLKLEVALPRTERASDDVVYWIATIIKISGYKVKLRYEGFTESSKDFWTNICSPDVHHIGYCARFQKTLVPPLNLSAKKVDWREYLLKRITGTRTLPENFYNQFMNSVGNHKFCKGMVLEVVDKTCIAAMRVAQVVDTVDCRLHLHYVGVITPEHNDFWCHKDSSLVHPVGWSSSVGHRINATNEYIQTSKDKALTKSYDTNDCTPDMFNSPNIKQASNGSGFAVGMKLESVDPLNLASICVATVMKVLKNGYLMIGIDGCMDTENGNDWFCYHVSSACVLPAGFCELANIPLVPPKGYSGKFSWKEYLASTKSSAAPVHLFNLKVPEHSFYEGYKLEAVDLMDPKLICVATVAQVAGRLVKLHFDGWEDSFDQWLDCESSDIYPVGWCEVMKYHLEGPKSTNL